MRNFRILLRVICALAIMLAAWDHRFAMNSDGISYLDMADAPSLVHPYWSPLYPGLLAAALRVFEPSPATEVIVVHLVNCLVGLLALGSFAYFETRWCRIQSASTIGLGYALFLWGTIEAIGLEMANPDLCASALIYLVAGLCCKLSNRNAVFLGVTLSLAYFAKSALLPLGAALLLLLAIRRQHRSGVAIASLVFGLLAGSYITALSIQQHRFTFGDSGRLNYAWIVLQQIPTFTGWIGEPPASGTPVHAPRISANLPELLEFKDTVPGTYPLWSNPAYFHEGLEVQFDFRKQASALVRNLKSIGLAHGTAVIPLLIGLIFLCFQRQFRFAPKEPWIILWPLSAFTLYALVVVEPRYIGPFLVLFWIAVYDAFGHQGNKTKAIVAACLFLTQMIPTLGAARHALDVPKAPVQLVVAQELTRLGLRRGDEIATMGYPYAVYYARLAGLKVIANIKGDGTPSDALRRELRRIGAKAIVIAHPRSGWQSIAGTGYSVQLLNHAPE